MLKRRLHNNKGVSAVEFAFILPILLAFLGGTIDFGVVFFASHIAQNAAREGARRAASEPGILDGDITDPAVIDRVKLMIPDIKLLQNFEQGITAVRSGCNINVTVSGTTPYFFLQVIGLRFKDPQQIVRQVTLRYEHDANCGNPQSTN